MEKVIFVDDFNEDAVGKSPSGWHTINDCRNDTDKVHLKVQKLLNHYALVTDSGHSLTLEPVFRNDRYLFDSTTIEFDFLLREQQWWFFDFGFCNDKPKSNCPHVQISNIQLGFHIAANNHGKGVIMDVFGRKNNVAYMPATYSKNETVPYPGDFKFNTWRHCKVTFNRGEAKCYIDGFLLYYDPKAEFYSGAFYVDISAFNSISNFKLHSTKTNYQIAKLLTERKLVTHAILFSVNESIMKPESVGFVAQLAEFLKENPTVKLEIDGHTDNIGDAGANMKLSQARAEEVKKQLIGLGVAGNRLTTKGFGTTRPIQPNNTAADLAGNRRVEFKLL